MTQGPLKVKVEPRHQSISVDYPRPNSNHAPDITFAFSANWYVHRGDNWIADGTVEFVLHSKSKTPRKLVIDGKIEEKFTPEERTELALEIKRQLKEKLIPVLERANGDVKRQVHTLW